MRPSHTGFNATDMVLQNTIFFSNNSLKSIVGANGCNLDFCKLRVSASLSTVGSSVFHSVCNIIFVRVPSQIIDGVIRGIAIIMAAFQSIWAGANKGSQNQRRNAKVFAFVLFPEKQAMSLRFWVISWLFWRARKCISDIPKIRNLVVSFIPRDAFPSFHMVSCEMNNPFVKYGTL